LFINAAVVVTITARVINSSVRQFNVCQIVKCITVVMDGIGTMDMEMAVIER